MELHKLKYLTSKILFYLLKGTVEYVNLFDRPSSITHYLVKDLRKKLEEDYSEKQIDQTLRYLKSKQYVQKLENKIRLTKNGEALLNKYIFNHLSKKVIHKPRKWDKKWRLIVFDIPEHQRAARDALRQKMKLLGLYKYQNSVWVYPYNIEKFINLINEVFETKANIKLITAVTIDDEEELLKYFKLNR